MISARIPLALVLLVPTFAAAKYDPDQDRAALRQAATASNDAANRAVNVPLLPERAGDIKSALDESVVQANLASGAAKSLDAGAVQRGAEMAGELKGHGAPPPASEAKDLGDAAAVQRARWKTISNDHDDLQSRVVALPDGKDKAELKPALARSADALTAADAALSRAETSAAAMTNAVAQMVLAEKRARASYAELSPADADVSRLDDALPPPVGEAKDSTALLGQEPQGPNRTRAGQKISVPRDLTGQLYSAADRASNRADDYHSRSNAFDRAKTGFVTARTDGTGAPDAAKAKLDDAEKTQAGVRDRLDHPKPRP